MSSFNLNQDYHNMIVRYVPASDDCNILSANIGKSEKCNTFELFKSSSV